MSTATAPRKKPQLGDTLRTTVVDKVAGWLMAFVILVGIGVFALLIELLLGKVVRSKLSQWKMSLVAETTQRASLETSSPREPKKLRK
jgi:hypothetical protein